MKPRIADNKPVPVELKAGQDYYFCTCGKSANQPFCDGSHAGTGFSPKSFTVSKDGEGYLCRCKQTANAPFCDGTHTQVPDDQVGKEFAVESPADADAMPAAKATPEEPTVAFIQGGTGCQDGHRRTPSRQQECRAHFGSPRNP